MKRLTQACLVSSIALSLLLLPTARGVIYQAEIGAKITEQTQPLSYTITPYSASPPYTMSSADSRHLGPNVITSRDVIKFSLAPIINAGPFDTVTLQFSWIGTFGSASSQMPIGANVDGFTDDGAITSADYDGASTLLARTPPAQPRHQPQQEHPRCRTEAAGGVR